MKKRMIFLAFVAVVLFAFTACRDGMMSQQAQEPSPEQDFGNTEAATEEVDTAENYREDIFWDGIFDPFARTSDTDIFEWDNPVDFIFVTDGINLTQPVILREGDVFEGSLSSGLVLERIISSNISTVNNQYFMWDGRAEFSGELVVRGDLVLFHNTFNWHEFHPYESDWVHFPRIVNDTRSIWFMIDNDSELLYMLGTNADEIEDFSDTKIEDIYVTIRNYTIQAIDGGAMNIAEIVEIHDPPHTPYTLSLLPPINVDRIIDMLWPGMQREVVEPILFGVTPQRVQQAYDGKFVYRYDLYVTEDYRFESTVDDVDFDGLQYGKVRLIVFVRYNENDELESWSAYYSAPNRAVFLINSARDGIRRMMEPLIGRKWKD